MEGCLVDHFFEFASQVGQAWFHNIELEFFIVHLSLLNGIINDKTPITRVTNPGNFLSFGGHLGIL